MDNNVGDAAVAFLLDEKEKDLELAARIGQSLLDENQQLQSRNEFLEEELTDATDKVGQLKEALQRKADLLQLVTEDAADSSSAVQSPTSPFGIRDDVESDAKSGRHSRCSTKSAVFASERRGVGIYAKVMHLEEENAYLAVQLASSRHATEELRDKEQKILTDCVKQMSAANERISLLHEELAEQSDENATNAELATRLEKEVASRQVHGRTLALDNEKLSTQLQTAQEIQTELSQEIMDLQERYVEVVAMLHEAQLELKQSRRHPRRSYSPDSAVYESLASELEQSDTSGVSSLPPIRRLPHLSTAPETSSPKRLFDEEAADLTPPPSGRNLAVETGNQWESSGRHRPSRSPTVDDDDDFKRPGIPPSLPREKDADDDDGDSNSSSTNSLFNHDGPSLGSAGRPGTKDLVFVLERSNYSVEEWEKKRRAARLEVEQKFLERSQSCQPSSFNQSFGRFSSLRRTTVSQNGDDDTHGSPLRRLEKFHRQRKNIDLGSAVYSKVDRLSLVDCAFSRESAISGRADFPSNSGIVRRQELFENGQFARKNSGSSSIAKLSPAVQSDASSNVLAKEIRQRLPIESVIAVVGPATSAPAPRSVVETRSTSPHDTSVD